MGLLNTQDVSASWISSPYMEITDKPILMGNLVWHPSVKANNRDVYFRAELNLPENPEPHHSMIATGR